MKSGILIVTLEMPAAQIIDRLVSIIGQVPSRSLASGQLTEREMDGVGRAVSMLNLSDLVIRDDLYDIASICAAARSMAKGKSGLAVLLVDYIQLVRANHIKSDNREREVAEVSRALRLLGLELGCLVIGITQLNKQGGSRESQSIEQDATCLMAVELEENQNERTIKIPRQRSGPSGVSTKMHFNGKTNSFACLACGTEETQTARVGGLGPRSTRGDQG